MNRNRSNAEIIYDQIINEDSIRNLFSSYETECLHFDFKNSDEYNKDTFKNMLGKSISGFSNADGGVLILGVAENKMKKKFELAPTEKFHQINAWTQELISRVTEPPNNNVVSKLIQSQAGHSSGYTIVLIPKSEIAPHQDVATRKYYQRAGESHKEMYHFQIADLFGRRSVPVLNVKGTLKFDSNNPTTVIFTIYVENKGARVAKFPFIQITEIGSLSKISYFTSWFLVSHLTRKPSFMTSDVNMVINSEIEVPVSSYFVTPIPPLNQKVEVRGIVGCDGIATRPFLLSFTYQDAQDVFGKSGILKEVNEL